MGNFRPTSTNFCVINSTRTGNYKIKYTQSNNTTASGADMPLDAESQGPCLSTVVITNIITNNDGSRAVYNYTCHECIDECTGHPDKELTCRCANG